MNLYFYGMRRIVSISLLGATLVFAPTLRAVAAESFELCEVASPCGNRLSQVVVTATRVPTPIDEVLAPFTVITREQLDNSLAPDVAEILQFEPGIDVIRAGGIGQPVSVFIRGAESNHTLVLIDGVRMNPGTIGIPALQNIPPQMIDHIEIVKGPRSTLYGTDAIGGVINIITRRATEPGVIGAGQIGYGSFDTRQASGVFGAAGTTMAGDVNASWIQSDGFPAKKASTLDSGYRNVSVGAHASASLGPVDASARFFQSQGTSSYFDFFVAPVSQDFVNRVSSLKLAAKPTEVWNTQLNLSRMDDLIRQNEPPTANPKDYLRTQRDTADWQNTIELFTDNRLIVGGIYQKENARSLSFGSLINEDTRITNIYAEDQWTRDQHSLVTAIGYTDHSNFGSIVTWNVEYGFHFTADTQLIAGGGTAFRAPDATDRFGFGGNPNLNPEKSRNLELSLRHRISDQQKTSLIAFENKIDDLINFDNATFLVGNIDRARIRGVEASYDFNARDWRLHMGASYQDPIDEGTGQLLLRRAKKSANVDLAYKFELVELGTSILAVGPRMDFGSPTSIELGSYVLANLNVRVRLPANLSVIGEVQNVLNTQYEVIHGYNTADRSYFVSLKYETK